MELRRLGLIKLCFSVFITILLLISIACEPGGDIKFQNLRDQNVTIYFAAVMADGSLDHPVKQGVISPNAGDTMSIIFLGSDFVQRIIAIDPSEKVVFWHDYKMGDLEKIGWKITIPP